MEIGVAGLAGSGKTSVFNALTHSHVQVGGFTGAAEAHRAVVKVPDPRIETLTVMFKPKSVKAAEVQYVDVGGLVKGSGMESANAVLGQLRTVDALLMVVAAFDDAATPASFLSDLETLETEFMLADLLVIDKRVERLAKEVRLASGTPAERTQRAKELEILKRLQQLLGSGQPLRNHPLEPEEDLLLRSYGLLSAKPALVIANVSDDVEAGEKLLTEAKTQAPAWMPEALAIGGRLEAELAELEAAEAEEFMSALGVTRLGADRVIEASYRALDLISFLTAGEDEVRAWTLKRGSTALDAAGTIHSDLARGFIRAEVVTFDDLVDAKTFVEARKRGKLRSEGKTYVVQDGDVINILFNV
jgi:ribosome-binding ATPase